MSALSPERRKLFIDFIARNACDDIIIQVMTRVTNNIEDAKTLEEYVKKANSVVPNVATPKTTIEDVAGPAESLAKHEMAEEDLGPPCSKLGANGQRIEKMLKGNNYPISAICDQLKLPASKVKPMVALLIQRGLVARVNGTNTYKAK